MRILLVYPKYPDTFWSFRYALKFISKKAAFPPLGLLTVAAMLPGEWDKKLVDINVSPLNDADIKWADYVFISAMAVQSDSAREVIARCRELGVKTVAGGPLFTTGYEDFNEVDHLVLGEAEATLSLFLKDIEKGCERHIYLSEARPDINQAPTPLWSLINTKDYSAMSLQYSRGCPFNCEFCDIIILNGHRPRTKNKENIIAELDALYRLGCRSSVFIVDDNFIGNKKKLKAETLPVIIEWMRGRKHPFPLFTEASINLADDDELIHLMTLAGFNKVFIGIETPNEESLAECSKTQNQNRDLIESIKKIQRLGLEVQGGFIVGFDSDPLSIFKKQISFIQNSGIVTAMVGLLNAPPGTRLYQRLKKENRLTSEFTGNNTDFSINFIPKMNHEVLINGYKNILKTIYSPKHYYERIRSFLKEHRDSGNSKEKIKFHHIQALVRSIWFLGIIEQSRMYYWNLLIITLLKYPRKFPLAINFAIYGYHFRKTVESYLRTPAKGAHGL